MAEVDGAIKRDGGPTLVQAMNARFEGPMELNSGHVLPGFDLSYETYGRLDRDGENAVLVCHSLTKGAHAAGRHIAQDAHSGWWDRAIGPGHMLDTDRYFVVCSDVLAGGASTGPASADPATGCPYGADFPVVTIEDMVNAQRRLMQHLGIVRLHAVIGGCFGGQQALQWAISHPDAVRNAVVIGTGPDTSAHTIAIFSVMRHLIRNDPNFNDGDYYAGPGPVRGLANALVAAVPLWMSRDAMGRRFARRTMAGQPPRYTLEPEFAVEAFLNSIANQPRPAIDPNSLLYLMRAEEYFDLPGRYGSLEAALKSVSARTLFVSYRTDWRYPSEETDRMHQVLLRQGTHSHHAVLDSPLGHGGFIYEVESLAPEVVPFLAEEDT
ncbi:homoserine O-acetyltransferase MetX [Streptomyces alanosinicus]|uniref:Probable acyltransferase n=1 Tax=Streptomyces alanosinicus TaxID=68171 RepID=A0A918MHM3_9ACTN|nr:homoserine O-acetyltransferase [Streptomyces alanosinicus]GGW25245.1 homoserine O-acetyltransferase [Streptomyces alanosinicus]